MKTLQNSIKQATCKRFFCSVLYILYEYEENYTNSKEDIQSAIQLLKGFGLSILDCARLIRNTIDFKPKKSKINNVQYCTFAYKRNEDFKRLY